MIRRALVVAKGDAILLSDLPVEVAGAGGQAAAGITTTGGPPPAAGEAGVADVVLLARRLFQWARKDPKL